MPLRAMIASTVVPLASAIAARLSPSSIETGAIVCQLLSSSVSGGLSVDAAVMAVRTRTLGSGLAGIGGGCRRRNDFLGEANRNLQLLAHCKQLRIGDSVQRGDG